MDNFKRFLASMAGRIVMTLVMAVLLFGLTILISKTNLSILIFVIFAVCSYFGWKVLNFITPNIFLIMPIGGWLLYFLIKFIVAFIIGYFVAPFKIGSMISKKISESVSAQ